MRRDFPDRGQFQHAIPGLILHHNLHGIDIDLRARQIAGLALWLRAQRAYIGQGLTRENRPKIARSNIACAEPMPGETALLKEYAAGLRPPLLGQLAGAVFEKMKLAGEAGSLLRIEEEIREAIARAKRQWQAAGKMEQLLLWPEPRRSKVEQLSLFDVYGISDAAFWDEAEDVLLEALEHYAEQTSDGSSYLRRLFADDAAQGFAFVDLCRRSYSVVLMNPPFGDPSKPSKAYIEEAYPRAKSDVFAAFVERGLKWLEAGGMLGAITSRTGFFLTSFERWREEILLKDAHPIVVADLGAGVLDTATVETAAYCLRRIR